MDFKNPYCVALVRVQITLAYVEAVNHNFCQSLVVVLFQIYICKSLSSRYDPPFYRKVAQENHNGKRT